MRLFKPNQRVVCVNKRKWVWISDLETETGYGPIFKQIYTIERYAMKANYKGIDEWFVKIKGFDSLYPEECFKEMLHKSAFDYMLDALFKVPKKDFNHIKGSAKLTQPDQITETDRKESVY